MIQKQNLCSRIAGISAIVLCAAGGLLHVKKPVQSVPAKPAPAEIVQAAEVRSLPGQLDSIPSSTATVPNGSKKKAFCSQPFPQTAKKSPQLT
ncbi:hypothetical protein QUA82_33840 [Microcoleus sp. F8-D3]